MCDHCPGAPCLGEQNKRLCELVDPTHPDYNPSYLKVLKPPGLLDKAESFVRAGINYIAAGMPDVTDDVFDKRMEICRACDSYNKEKNECEICGCNLGLKCRMGSESCPLNKWSNNSFVNNTKGATKRCGCG